MRPNIMKYSHFLSLSLDSRSSNFAFYSIDVTEIDALNYQCAAEIMSKTSLTLLVCKICNSDNMKYFISQINVTHHFKSVKSTNICLTGDQIFANLHV